MWFTTESLSSDSLWIPLYSSEHTTRIWHCLSWFQNYNTNSLHKQITTNKISPILCFPIVQMCFLVLLLNSIHYSKMQKHNAQDALVLLHVKLLWIHAEDCQLSQVQKALTKLKNQRGIVVLILLLLYMHVATGTCVS